MTDPPMAGAAAFSDSPDLNALNDSCDCMYRCITFKMTDAPMAATHYSCDRMYR